jgi:hypothetical protein
MLYPLSYEGGGVFMQVRPYFLGLVALVPFGSVPLACPIDRWATSVGNTPRRSDVYRRPGRGLTRQMTCS